MRDNIHVHDEGDIDRLAWKIFAALCVMGIRGHHVVIWMWDK